MLSAAEEKQKANRKVRYYLTIFLILVTAAANYAFSRPEPVLQRHSLTLFPRVIGEWKSIGDQFIDDASMKVLLVDDYIMRNYINPKGDVVGLYIGYFKTQREGKQVHSPRQCLPGAGWAIVERRVVPLNLKDHDPPEVPINYYLMEKGTQHQLYLWWYQGRGRIYASEYLNKLYRITDALTMNRTDGALVRVNMMVRKNADQTLQTEMAFINLIMPMIADYIPN